MNGITFGKVPGITYDPKHVKLYVLTKDGKAKKSALSSRAYAFPGGTFWTRFPASRVDIAPSKLLLGQQGRSFNGNSDPSKTPNVLSLKPRIPDAEIRRCASCPYGSSGRLH